MKARTHTQEKGQPPHGSLWPKLCMMSSWRGGRLHFCVLLRCVLTDSVTFALIDFVTATQMAVVNKGLGVELGVITMLHCQEL